MSRIEDIAKKANVSTATVSRYINKSGYVGEETGRLIESVCREIGYPKRNARRNLEGGMASNVIGVVITQFNSFFLDVVASVQRVASQNGMEVLICNSDETTGVEIRQIEILKKRVGGIIIAPANTTSTYNSDYLYNLDRKGMPVVLIDRDIPSSPFDGVFVDGFSGAYDAVTALIRAGHKDITIISGPTTCKPGLDRLNGYLQAMKDHNLPVNERNIMFADFDEEKTYKMARRRLRETSRSTAFFTANICMGLGFLRAVEDLGLSIPDDVAFITFDDYPTFGFKNNNFSIVRNQGAQIGEDAAKILIDRMTASKRTKSPTRRVVLSPALELRGSEKMVTG